MISLRSLEAFYWVVKLGGFSRAADKIHMTQPAVSSRIAKMEQSLGVRLIERNTHQAATATGKGLELFSYAEQILRLQNEIIENIRDDAEIAGLVRLGASETLIFTLMRDLVRQLRGEMPKITLEIVVADSTTLQSMLFSGEIDLAMSIGPVNAPDVVNLELTKHELVWVASPKLDLESRTFQLPELIRWPLLSFACNTVPYSDLQRLVKRVCPSPPRVFASSSIYAILQMAIDLVGIGILPDRVVEPYIAMGDLVAIDVADKLPPIGFSASYFESPSNRPAEEVARLARRLSLSNSCAQAVGPDGAGLENAANEARSMAAIAAA